MRYDNDSRITGTPETGYTFTHSDGTTLQVKHTDVFGWTICHGPNLDLVPAAEGGFAIGFATADDAIGAIVDTYDPPTQASTDQAGPHQQVEAQHQAVEQADNGADSFFGAGRLKHLADRCERGATELLREADNAAEELKTRANGHLITPEDWAAQKRSAATAAQTYAAQLREEAAELGPRGHAAPERLAQAEKVAHASELGGILIDPALLTAAQLNDPWNNDDQKQAIKDDDDAKRAAVEGSGMFEHIDETIGGIRQVPFWRLTAPTATDHAEADQAPETAATTITDQAEDDDQF